MNQDIVKKLNDLVHLDIDAVFAYEQALKHIDADVAKVQLAHFQEEHQHHITELSDIIRSLGGTPTESQDVRGLVMEGLTILRSVTGSTGALKAIRAMEEITNRLYEAALGADLPPDVHEVVLRHREDELRHLHQLQAAIEEARLNAQPGLAFADGGLHALGQAV